MACVARAARALALSCSATSLYLQQERSERKKGGRKTSEGIKENNVTPRQSLMPMQPFSKCDAWPDLLRHR